MVGEVYPVLRKTDEEAMDEIETAGVQIEVEAFAEIMIDGVYANIEDGCGTGASGQCGWEDGLSLAAEADVEFDVWIAKTLAKTGVLDDDSEDDQTQQSIRRSSCRSISVVVDVRHKRQK